MTKKLVSIVLVLLMTFSIALANGQESGFLPGVGDWEYNLGARMVQGPYYDEFISLKWSKNVEYDPTIDPIYFFAYSWGDSGYMLVNCESYPSDTLKYVRTLKWQLTSDDPILIQHVGKMYELIDDVYVLISEEVLEYTEAPYGLGLFK